MADRHPPVSPRTAVLLEVARLSRGWSYRQAAYAIGCSHEFVRLLESCQRAPSALMAREIAVAYRLNRDEADLLSAESAGARPSGR
jgi:transcriptional regulator with XRE-family HTH domain